MLEAFGLPPLERPLSKTTMKVKNFSDTKWSKKVHPLPCIAMEKMDGVSCVMININGTTLMFSREGKLLKNLTKYTELYSNMNLDCLRNTVVTLEICNNELSLEQISGIVNPNRKEPLEDTIEEVWLSHTYLAAFDMVNLDHFIIGQDNYDFNGRLYDLSYIAEECNFVVPSYHYFEQEEEVQQFFKFVTDNGGEGIVRCLPNSHWIAGYKNHAKTKQVRGIDFDLEVIDVEEGLGKRANMVANLVVRWRSGGDLLSPPERLSVDGRFTDTTRIEWWNTPSLIIGKIVHVHALQMGSKGSLRLPKVQAVRIDKHEADL